MKLVEKDKKSKLDKAKKNKQSILNMAINPNFKKDENVNPRPSYAKNDET